MNILLGSPTDALRPAQLRPSAWRRLGAGVAALATAALGLVAGHAHAARSLGPNVLVFDPTMSVSQIKAQVDAIASQQAANEFGPERYALLFKPGTYGSAAEPLNFQVGYYTAVAGLGRSPGDVVINGSINVYNRCRSGVCFALDNFWRAMSNLTIKVTDPAGAGCYAGNFWAVSQAAPMRRVHVDGHLTLMDYCTGPSFASGGFIADSKAGNVINGSQQQFLVRDSKISGWSNGVWNQVFSGVEGAPPTCFPQVPAGCGPYTTLPTSPITREAPYLYLAADGYRVFVPTVRYDSKGTTWEAGPTAGRTIPLSDFYIAWPGDKPQQIDNALARGKHLLFTPGIYAIDRTLKVRRAGTVVLGLGLPSLVPQGGAIPMSVADVPDVSIAGVMFDAGPVNSPVLLQVGSTNPPAKPPKGFPTTVSDVFFRIGGPAAGKATISLEVNSSNVILDNIWAWRADHGNGVGWDINTGDTGVVVYGDHVTAYGLFVEHYQKHNAIWKGNDGKVIMFQNELPYDPPSQAAWMSASGGMGWAALKLSPRVKRFNAWGLGSYSFFNQGVDIFASNAFQVPATLPPGSLQNMLTVFLNPDIGMGGILNVVNGIGGPSTIANPSTPVTVLSYP